VSYEPDVRWIKALPERIFNKVCMAMAYPEVGIPKRRRRRRNRNLDFCRDLLNRMLSASDIWSRVVTPLKDLPDKMDLRLIKSRLEGEVKEPQEFERDVRQMFLDSSMYGTEDKVMSRLCTGFEIAFQEIWAEGK
jgi:hypothetical protein